MHWLFSNVFPVQPSAISGDLGDVFRRWEAAAARDAARM
jgi:hypothetical protein